MADAVLTLHVLLFAQARALLGQRRVQVDVPAPATVSGLRRALAERCPQAAPLLARSGFAVNQSWAADSTPLSAADEVAWIPPVSGG